MRNKKILIVKNISREGPGLLELVLKDENISFNIVDLDKGEKFPDPREYSAVFVFGGPDSANDQNNKMGEELKRVKQAVDAGIPYFGVCLGMQTLVKAAAGEIYKHDTQEIGLRDSEGNYFEIDLTNEGKKDPIFIGLKSPLKIFHLHGETVSLGDGMMLLATGKYCRNQVVKIGNSAYGFQGHLELTDLMLEQWIVQDPDLKPLSAASLKSDYNDIRSEYQNNGRTILNNFLELALRVRI